MLVYPGSKHRSGTYPMLGTGVTQEKIKCIPWTLDLRKSCDFTMQWRKWLNSNEQRTVKSWQRGTVTASRGQGRLQGKMTFEPAHESWSEWGRWGKGNLVFGGHSGRMCQYGWCTGKMDVLVSFRNSHSLVWLRGMWTEKMLGNARR